MEASSRDNAGQGAASSKSDGGNLPSMETVFYRFGRPIEKKKRRWPISGIGALATVVIAIAGIYFGVAQLLTADHLQAEDNRLQTAQLDSHLEEVMMNLDRYFAVHPRLRPYFFAPDNAEQFPPIGHLRSEAMGTAEMIIDFADDVGAYAEKRKMDPTDSARWAEIVGSYFKESPIMRYMWKEAELFRAYSTSTACILRAPIEHKRLEAWDWRENAPREVARQCS
jgi:hypothetical protein